MTGVRRFFPLAAFALCLGAIYPLQRAIDTSHDAEAVADEYLYLSDGDKVKRLAVGYESLLSDVYWLRSVQYFGDKVLRDPSVLNERSQRLKLLYPLIDVTTTLDPKFVPAYRFGAFFVNDYVDEALAVKLLDKGIANVPDAWRLRQDKAFLLWSSGDCDAAGDEYEAASRVAGAPAWLAPVGTSVRAECADDSTAVQLYEKMIESTDDEQVRENAQGKIAGIMARSDIAALSAGVARYREASGANPPSLARLLGSGALAQGTRLRLDATGTPVDPVGVPYAYDPETGTVTPGPGGARIPRPVIAKRPPAAAAP